MFIAAEIDAATPRQKLTAQHQKEAVSISFDFVSNYKQRGT